MDQHRLVTVTGPGGMGKTQLAQALLHLRARASPHGMCWVDLGSVTAPESLPGAVLVALGLQPAPGPARASLLEAAAGLQMLVALDNAEHLVDAAAALVQGLLDAAPRLRLVVTRQVPLRLALALARDLHQSAAASPSSGPGGPSDTRRVLYAALATLMLGRAEEASVRQRCAERATSPLGEARAQALIAQGSAMPQAEARALVDRQW